MKTHPRVIIGEPSVRRPAGGVPVGLRKVRQVT